MKKPSPKTDAEVTLALHLTGSGIAFQRQHRYIPGRNFRADFALLPYRILVEIQGGIWHSGAHGSITGILADITRLNLATLHNWRILRFTPDQVESGEAVATIEKVLMT